MALGIRSRANVSGLNEIGKVCNTVEIYPVPRYLRLSIMTRRVDLKVSYVGQETVVGKVRYSPEFWRSCTDPVCFACAPHEPDQEKPAILHLGQTFDQTAHPDP